MNIVALRNSYTNGRAGGDVHLGQALNWFKVHEKANVTLIFPENDGQVQSYGDTKNLTLLTYRKPTTKPLIIDYLVRIFLTTRLKIKKTEPIDVAVSGSQFLTDVLPVLLSRQLRSAPTKVIYVHHILQKMDRKKSLSSLISTSQEKFALFVVKKLNFRVIAGNRLVSQQLQEIGFQKNSILVSSYAIITDRKHLMVTKKYDLSFCGRLHKLKGVYDFLDIVEKLQNSNKETKAVMIGDGKEKASLLEEIRLRKLNIRLVGFVSDQKKYKLLCESRLLLHPSKEEGWGLVIGEAMSLAVPVVAYDLSAYKDPFGEAPIDFKGISSIKQLESAVVDTLKLYEQPLRIDELRKSLMKFSERFAVSSIFKDQYEFYEK